MTLPIPDKTTAGWMGVMTVVILTIFGAYEGMVDGSSNGMVEAVKQNTSDIKEHEKLAAHPVAANELKHINTKLDHLDEDMAITMKTVFEIHTMLCSLTEKC